MAALDTPVFTLRNAEPASQNLLKKKRKPRKRRKLHHMQARQRQKTRMMKLMVSLSGVKKSLRKSCHTYLKQTRSCIKICL